jgi:hypothetical protein
MTYSQFNSRSWALNFQRKCSHFKWPSHNGVRYRRGEPISTAFFESAINEIIARRMIKKQQMRWNRWTVQPFLDVRVAVLDGTLEGSFRRLFPDFRPANDTGPIPAAA